MPGVESVPVLPPKARKGEYRGVTIRLTEVLWDEIDTLAKARGYSRNEAVETMLEWAIAEAKKEGPQEKGKR